MHPVRDWCRCTHGEHASHVSAGGAHTDDATLLLGRHLKTQPSLRNPLRNPLEIPSGLRVVLFVLFLCCFILFLCCFMLFLCCCCGLVTCSWQASSQVVRRSMMATFSVAESATPLGAMASSAAAKTGTPCLAIISVRISSRSAAVTAYNPSFVVTFFTFSTNVALVGCVIVRLCFHHVWHFKESNIFSSDRWRIKHMLPD